MVYEIRIKILKNPIFRKNTRSKIDQRSFKASSRGLVVKVEDSRPRDPGFNPPLWRPFFRHHSFGSKLGTKICGKL